MNECDSKLKDLKKLRHKAELSRDINSRLKEKFQSHLSWKKFGTVSLSTTLTLVIGLYYRELLSGEWVTIAVLALPIIVVMLETLDNTIFRWVDKINGHESAVQIWGSWIRKANFLDEEWLSKEDSVRDEELKKLQREYIDCMDRTVFHRFQTSIF